MFGLGWGLGSMFKKYRIQLGSWAMFMTCPIVNSLSSLLLLGLLIVSNGFEEEKLEKKEEIKSITDSFSKKEDGGTDDRLNPENIL